jgi:uroporphyrinogen-III synthase
MRPDPLSGFTIGVTADRRSDEQIRLLTSRGAAVMHGAVIKTHPLGPEDDLRTATQQVIDVGPDVIVLTTGVGVRGWLEAADAAQLGDSLRDVFETSELFARGPKAVGALATAGFSVTWRAQQARYSDVVAGLLERGVQGATVAVQLDGAGAGELCDEIEALGATVVRVPVYRWSLPEDLGPAEKLIRAVIDRRVDALTFTAKPAVENFFEIAALIGLHGELIDAVSSGVGIFCVGPVCATGFTNLGLHVSQVPDKHRLGALVQMVAGAFAERSNFISIGGVGVRLQGRYLTVDGSEPVALTERERSLLSVLLEKPGAVYSKTVLLKRVWHDTESDEHVVEVTMARLRQRLGTAAPGIETVIRRGYRLSAA